MREQEQAHKSLKGSRMNERTNGVGEKKGKGKKRRKELVWFAFLCGVLIRIIHCYKLFLDIFQSFFNVGTAQDCLFQLLI